MTALLAVEVRRALSRRLVRTLILIALLGIVVLALGAFFSSEPDTADAYSSADIWAGNDEPGDANTLGQTSGLFVLMGLLGGASFIGAEYKAGTIATVLTWEPRRVRVIAGKLLAAGIVAAAAYVVLQAMLGAALIPAVIARGDDAGLDSEFYWRVGGLLLRGGLVTGGAAVLGASLAALGRNTTAALGVALGYLIVVEQILRGLRPGWHDWFLLENLFLVLVGRPEEGSDIERSVISAGILLTGYLVAVAVVASVAFARRDVT
ncbi:MAG TPA: ABC transporter permease subunit [Acidimicrobiia bacterium]|nr:ABC transporter permease subunit [Acidimicrobiia bacterium]